jgi:hypothetical protein
MLQLGRSTEAGLLRSTARQSVWVSSTSVHGCKFIKSLTSRCQLALALRNAEATCFLGGFVCALVGNGIDTTAFAAMLNPAVM